MYILGISAFYHDSAAAIISDDEIIAAAQEERFTRKKHDDGFPINAIKYCLEESGASEKNIGAIAFYDKPLLKFERLLETYYGFAPKGLPSFLTAMPVWIREKLFLKKIIRDGLKDVLDLKKYPVKILFPEHHLSHAASAFYPSHFDEAAILTIDGVGEWSTASICHGKGNKIKVISELKFPHSIGLLYSAFTYYAGFKVNSGEYKLMGLAPYGDPDSDQTKKFLRIIFDELIDLKNDGSVWLNQKYFSYAYGLRMVNDKKWEQLFGISKRLPETGVSHDYCNLALAIQQATDEIVMKMAQHAKEITGSKNLCMAGGVALNCVSNGRLLREKIFDAIYIQPAAGDAGGAMGAALAARHIFFGKERKATQQYDEMKGSYLGPQFSEREILSAMKNSNAVFQHFENFDELTNHVAFLLAGGNVVGWFQGRMEWGPRALGDRSILADARNEQMQKRLNLKIKYRESFRPFAPAVLSEDRNLYFDLDEDSPYMLLVDSVKASRCHQLPHDFHKLDLKDRLYFSRSDIPAITHLDFSARIQTVHRETNGRFWKLIDAFKKITGYSLLVNTSFNVRGEPIVCSPADAYRCMMSTEMDYLVMENFLLERIQQPEWKERPKSAFDVD